ncbi:MAG: PorT family protein, partial [Bacteroidales bacterium]|nr:PorT family protein [Bacteroidales bacterium]
MKKILLLLFIMFAALDHFGQFTLGPKIGYNTSKLSTDFDSIKESIKSNFQIGAFARFGKKLYLQPELYYATSGGTLKLEGTDLKETIKMKNLCVPVLVGYKLINAKVINLRIMAGPVANFILNKEVDASDLIQDPLQDSDFKNVAWGFDVGAGVDVFFL